MSAFGILTPDGHAAARQEGLVARSTGQYRVGLRCHKIARFADSQSATLGESQIPLAKEGLLTCPPSPPDSPQQGDTGDQWRRSFQDRENVPSAILHLISTAGDPQAVANRADVLIEPDMQKVHVCNLTSLVASPLTYFRRLRQRPLARKTHAMYD